MPTPDLPKALGIPICGLPLSGGMLKGSSVDYREEDSPNSPLLQTGTVGTPPKFCGFGEVSISRWRDNADLQAAGIALQLQLHAGANSCSVPCAFTM